MRIVVGARSSPLSRSQFDEVAAELKLYHPHLIFDPVWVKTTGDLDKKTSLRTLGKSDFFTRELDQMLLQGEIRIAIHSAKDLPEPIVDGLSLIAMTCGVDPRDSLVFRPGENLETLPKGAIIATSSERREEAVKALRSDLRFTDLRGNIGERLEKLQNGEADGIVVAEAALIRLKLTHLNRIFLPGETTLHQGRLAILARSDDEEMRTLFTPLHFEPKTILYLGLDPRRWPHPERIFHYPVIRTKRLDSEDVQEALRLWPRFTHIVFTSKSAVRHWWEVESRFGDKIAIAIGEGTAGELRLRGVAPLVAPEAVQEGVIALLETMDLENGFLFLPRSKKARCALNEYLEKKRARFFALDLYDAFPQQPGPVPSLDSIEEIVFTSPSTVKAFVKIFGSLPKGKKLTPIGPVTRKILEEAYCRKFFSEDILEPL